MATILIIEDDDAFRKMLSLTLEKWGYVVQLARHGREGVRLAEKNKFDLVITDIIMPEMEGLETIMALKKIAPELKILAISGGGRVSATDFLKAARQFGAVATLAKPFSMTELKFAMEQLCIDPPKPTSQTS